MKRALFLTVTLVLLASTLFGCAPAAEAPQTGPAPVTDVPGAIVPTEAAASNPPAQTGSTRDTLIVAVPDAPVNLDPHIQANIATFRITTNMFDRLVQLDNDMKLIPVLAESWEVENDTTTVFFLRQGVKFHNGEEMKAEDVKFSLERTIASPGVNYNYLIIKEIQIVDDYTVKIVTKAPFNALLYRLTLDAAAIVSKKAAESGEDFNKNPVGAGPFMFKSWELGGDVVLEAFPDYWAGASPVKTLIFRQIPEAINRSIGLETGEVDLAYDLATTDFDIIKGNSDLTLQEVPSLTVWYLGFNTKQPILDNVKVRQAIAYALNKDDFILNVFNGVAEPAHNTMLTPTLFGYAPDTMTYDFNLEKAKELLAEAGYPDGFKTTLWTTDSQFDRDASVVVQEQLRKIGIEVEVKSMERGTYLSSTAEGKHDLFLATKTSIDPDSMLRAMYHTQAFGASGNKSFWALPELDEKMDRASVTLDQNEAETLYIEIQTAVAEQVPLIPIAIEYLNAGMQNYVKGYGLYPGKTHHIYGTYFED